MVPATFLLLLGVLLEADCYIVDPGPVVKATKGGVWPKPQEQILHDGYHTISPLDFKFTIEGESCELITDAVDRYTNIIQNMARSRSAEKSNVDKDRSFEGILDTLEVRLNSSCTGNEQPSAHMDESYELVIRKDGDRSSDLVANTPWGIIRGLETFSQLIYWNEDHSFRLNLTKISDYPRFTHRGLLLDTSRHFMPLYIIFQTLNAMAFNKLNVFHWHIVDDHSFPYQSIHFPELSNKGAFHPVTKIYTQEDIQKVIEYARVRGIRVLVEFDTPGHTRSWGEGVEKILTPCYNRDKPTGSYGPMNPAEPSLYRFLVDIFQEVTKVFPEKYLHLGGDEVEFECWASNKKIRQFMKELNITGNYVALESYYMQKLLKIITKFNVTPVVWEEVFVNGINLPEDIVVHVWKGDGCHVMDQVTKSGRHALLSSCWYLDHIKTGGDWQDFYRCDPHSFTNNKKQQALVLGGEACMWAESVNEFNVGPRIWPRASAAAEKLWSKKNADTFEEASRRLEEHACRMNSRNIPAQPPNGPGACL